MTMQGPVREGPIREGGSIIQPFGFDRVFFHPIDTPPAASAPEAAPTEELSPTVLRAQIEDMEKAIERMKAEHRAELSRARMDGFEAGMAQVRGERGEALLAATDALHAALDTVEQRFEGVVRTIVSEAGSVALHAAEMLAGHAIENAPVRAIEEALGRVLEQVMPGTTLVVRAHPELRDQLAALIEAREAKAGRALAITVVTDEGVPEGDARIEWSAGGLNVNAEARRAAVMAELAGVLL